MLPESSIHCALMRGLLMLGVVTTCPAANPSATAQQLGEISRSLLEDVMPAVDSFAPSPEGRPVLLAFRATPTGEHVLVGYVFLTSDFPPEPLGYSGPIVTLVGLDLDANVTGARIVDYWESHRSSMGDFLRGRGVQEQFAHKHASEAFRVGGDIDGISRATISVRALARGVRNAARRVMEEFLVDTDPLGVTEDLTTLSWLDLRRLGVVERINVSDRSGSAEILVVYLEDVAFREVMVGASASGMIERAVQSRDDGGHVMAYAINGSSLRYFSRDGWAVAQHGDTISLEIGDIFSFGLASGGMLDREIGSGGAMIIPNQIDVERPFALIYQLGPALQTFSVQYHTQAARQLLAAAAQTPEPAVTVPESVRRPVVAPVMDPNISVVDSPDVVASVDGRPRDAPSTESTPVQATQFEVTPSETASVNEDPVVVSGIIDTAMRPEISWRRVLLTAAVLGLATMAFVLKHHALGMVTLGVTLVFFGFVDGGFLSISHLTSAIWVGSSAVAGDAALLLLITFTLVTTILVGRVFCGFLCPFGALQDFIARVVPKRFQRTVPWDAHRLGLLSKYVVLVVIVVSAIFASRVSLYQYFEPFGTVFYGSPLPLLWVIAIGFVIASAVVPRFYCRYVCPLGAGLAVLSLVSLKRIRRVEQCETCKVCEHACPTGAIRGPDIDFKECVRCNICEIKLIEKAGVCRHDVATVRERLVQIQGIRS